MEKYLAQVEHRGHSCAVFLDVSLKLLRGRRCALFKHLFTNGKKLQQYSLTQKWLGKTLTSISFHWMHEASSTSFMKYCKLKSMRKWVSKYLAYVSHAKISTEQVRPHQLCRVKWASLVAEQRILPQFLLHRYISWELGFPITVIEQMWDCPHRQGTRNSYWMIAFLMNMIILLLFFSINLKNLSDSMVLFLIYNYSWFMI